MHVRQPFSRSRERQANKPSHFSMYRRVFVLTLMLVAAVASLPAAEEASPPPTVAPTRPTRAEEAPYLAANDAAMATMMRDMTVKPTGDVDRDFVALMTPHHQGAIDMARAFLRYGHNEQLRRLAQEIIVTQQQEIAVMRLAVGEPLPPPAPSPPPSPALDGQPTPPNPPRNSSVPGNAP